MVGELHAIDGQAALWVERMGGPVLDTAVAADFNRWILKDPRHIDSYARLSAVWQSGALACALQEADGSPEALNDDEALPFARQRPGLLRGVAMVLTAAAACIAVFLSMPLLTHEGSFATSPGGTRLVVLSDGSRIRLSGDTRITARITPWSRHVGLDRGEAFFDVAHEQVRPFTVDAGGASVSVLGTAFDIDRIDRQTHIIQVYRGLVSVAAGEGREWRLPAGSGLELSGNRVRSLSNVEGASPGWTEGWYEANGTPVWQLIQRLNRSSPVPVVLERLELGELLMTGRLRTANPEDMLDAIAAVHELRWSKVDGRYVLARQSSNLHGNAMKL